MAIRFKIDNNEIPNILEVRTDWGFPYDADGNRVVGPPPPMTFWIKRECTEKSHADLKLWAAAIKNPKKITAEIKLPDAGGKDSYTFDLESAFIASWDFVSCVDGPACEEIVISAGDVKLTAGGAPATYKAERFDRPGLN